MSGQHREGGGRSLPTLTPLFGKRAPGRHRLEDAGDAAYRPQGADGGPSRHRGTHRPQKAAQRPKPPPRRPATGARQQLAERAATQTPPRTRAKAPGHRVTPLTDRPDPYGVKPPVRTSKPWHEPARETLARRRPVMGQPSVSEERARQQYTPQAATQGKHATDTSRKGKTRRPKPKKTVAKGLTGYLPKHMAPPPGRGPVTKRPSFGVKVPPPAARGSD